MSFNIPIESTVNVALSGATINIPSAITASGDEGILRQSPSRDLFVTGSVGVYQETNPWNVNGSISIAGYGDSPSIDAFARLRVSNPVTLFENKQLYDRQPLIWSEITSSGGDILFNSNRASCLLTTDGTNGSSAIRQTKQRIDYQPGKSLLIFTTFVLGVAGNNLRKRLGYFNANNGVFLQQTSSALSFVIRSFATGVVTENVVNQSSWNLDRLDGTGISGITLDVTKAQILLIDVEWLGVGRVRVGFVINGLPIYVHEFNHANVISSVYMSTPNLPIRFEITNTAAGDSGELEEICATALSEGGYSLLGILRSKSREATPIAIASADGLVPLISIRLKSTHIGSTIIPIDLSIISSAATTYRWVLILNPVVAGVDAASWTPISGSAVEYDISRTTTNSLTGGTVIKNGYVVGQGNSISAADSGDLQSLLVVSADINDAPDQLVLAVQRIGAGGAVDYYGSLSWREIS